MILEVARREQAGSISEWLAVRDLNRLGVDVIPTGWSLSSVGDACDIRNELRLPIAVEDRVQMDGPFPYYGPTGVLGYINEYRAEGEFALIGEDGDHFLDPLRKPQTVRVSGRFNVNNHAHLIAGTDKCEVEWFAYFFRNRDIFHSLTRQGASRFKLTKASLEKLPILLPPLPEQRCIAEILRTWDEAIEKLEALRAAKEQRRDGILQQIFGNGVDFPSDWQAKPMSAVTTRVSRTNDGGNHPVMTISAKSGFLMQSEKFARDMAGSSVDKYTLLHQGEFAYNKGNSKTAPYGCIFALDRPTAVIPFVYFCFRLNDGHDHRFFEQMFKAGILNHQLSKVINSGVRNDGLLNLYADDFFSCVVPVPPRDEQERISRAITALNDDIALTDNEIAALQRQKRGLMQKLLTGEWRVAANSEAEVVE